MAAVLLVLLHSLIQNFLITKCIMSMIDIQRWALLLWPEETLCEFMFKMLYQAVEGFFSFPFFSITCGHLRFSLMFRML